MTEAKFCIPGDHFVRASNWDKKDGCCVPCRKKRQNAYYAANKQKWKDRDLKARTEDAEAYKAANRDRQATHRASPTNTIRLRYLKARYNLTIEQYAAMEAAQGGVCAICRQQSRGSDRRLHVDHDHATGRVRGLLCFSCNAGLGNFDDRREWLEAAIQYLATSCTAS